MQWGVAGQPVFNPDTSGTKSKSAISPCYVTIASSWESPVISRHVLIRLIYFNIDTKHKALPVCRVIASDGFWHQEKGVYKKSSQASTNHCIAFGCLLMKTQFIMFTFVWLHDDTWKPKVEQKSEGSLEKLCWHSHVYHILMFRCLVLCCSWNIKACSSTLHRLLCSRLKSARNVHNTLLKATVTPTPSLLPNPLMIRSDIWYSNS